MKRREFRYLDPMRVRWAEVDMQRIVFNGHYLTYFDIAVTEYWRQIGLPYPQATAETGGELYTVRSVVEYASPARYDDEIDLYIRCKRIGRSSLTFVLEIRRGDQALVNGELVYVHADPRTRKSAPLPPGLLAAIERFERVAPARN